MVRMNIILEPQPRPPPPPPPIMITQTQIQIQIQTQTQTQTQTPILCLHLQPRLLNINNIFRISNCNHPYI